MGQYRPMHSKELLNHCATLTAQLLRFDHPADQVVAHYFRDQRALGPRERALVAETVYTILRRKLQLEAWAQSGSGPLERRLAILAFAGDHDALLAALTPTETQWLAHCKQAMADAAPAHNLPAWLAENLQAQQGSQFDAAAAALLQTAPLDLRVNTLHSKRDAVLKALEQNAISATATPYSPWGIRLQGKPHIGQLNLFRQGHVEVQDEGSQLLALLLDAKRNEIVVDFCAGAGGKTLALGAAMRNTGRLYAFDVSAHRLEQLKPRLTRSGLGNVYPMAIADETDARIQRLAGKVDRVLIDAPCSGLGTLRRKPDVKWRLSPKDIPAFAATQAAILRRAARLLKPGGRLVYATCSLLPAENEAVAMQFSAEQKSAFMPLNAAQILQSRKIKDAMLLCSPAEAATAATATDAAAGQFLRLWPHLHGTDGFFAAVWQKK